LPLSVFLQQSEIKTAPTLAKALDIVHVDAFTDKRFSGNPAAVCVLSEKRDDGWMQQLARELNLSETAFLLKDDGDGESDTYSLRWFTPSVEVDLCGHATVASAHVLWEREEEAAAGMTAGARRPLRFRTKSGLLAARMIEGGWIELDFPALPAKPAKAPKSLEKALGVRRARFVGKSRFDYLIEVDSEKTVRKLSPDYTLLASIPARGVIVTARSSSSSSSSSSHEKGGHDFVSRFFAPRTGINEDPVTGSAHCVLAPYWAGRLGKNELTGYQASARGGTVRVWLDGDRVRLGGKAVTVMRCHLMDEDGS
jgi:PhzF family phenazine biosynthesis protein